MITKDKVQEIADHQLGNFPVDDLIERTFLMQKIEIARKEIKNGEGIDWEDLKKEMDSWLE
jgi:hypothetical protein